MKTKNYLKKMQMLAFLSLFLAPQINSYGNNGANREVQTTDNRFRSANEETTTVHVPVAGQLSAVLPASAAADVVNLTITGFLNTTDFTHIRNNVPNVVFLDISKITIANATLPSQALDGKNKLQEVILPDSIKTIDQYAFRNCSSLKKINLPDSLELLRNYSFQNCSSLASIQFPKKLQTIEAQVFYDCSALAGNLAFPESLETIGSAAFRGCTSIKQVSFSKNLKTISTDAFNGCSTLAGEINLPEGLTTLGDRAFQDCPAIQSLSLPSTLTAVGGAAFYHNYALKQIAFSQGLKTIGNSAFQECTSLQVVHLQDSLTTINQYAFAGCAALIQLTLPEGLKTIGIHAFEYCYELTGELLLPASLTSIGGYAFYQDYKLNSCRIQTTTPPALSNTESIHYIRTVYVPETAASAYKAATYWKDRVIVGGELKSITLTVTPGDLGEQILREYDYLSDVHVMKLRGTLNSTDFGRIRDDMPSLVSVDLSECSNTDLPDNLFRNHYALQDIKFPAKLEKIGANCFYQCHSLKTPEFPASLENIGNYAFHYCYNLYDLNLPASLKSIGAYAFQYCYFLLSVQLQEGLQSIGDYTFADCSRLKEMLMPNTVTSIGTWALAGCSALNKVSIPDHMTVLRDGTFYGCGSLTNIQLPSQLTTLESNVFRNCTRLASITLPAGLVSMYDNNYYSYSSFYNCTGLKQIICLQATPPVLNNDAFYGVDRNTCELIVPRWAQVSYQLANIWKSFLNINKSQDEIKDIVVNGELILASNEDLRPLGMPNVTITPSGNLLVQGNMPFNSDAFVLRPQLNRIDDLYGTSYSRLISNCNAMTAQEVKIDMSAVANRWYFLSFPFDVKLSDISIDADAQFVFRRYDGAARADQGTGNSWKNMDQNETLRAGTGYIFQCSKNVSHLILKATEASKNMVFGSTAKTVALNDYPSANAADRGWNLVGNPFPSFYDARCMDYTAPITYWND